MTKEVTMPNRIICLFVLSLSLLVLFTEAQGAEKEKVAVEEAKQWLLLVDSGNYEQSWKEASDYFRNAVSQVKWAQSLQAVRSPLGNLISREVKSSMYKTSLPGAPDGEYVIIQFVTSFSNKKSAIETVTPMLEKDGRWRVTGYYIK
jgi:hypothetical protein